MTGGLRLQGIVRKKCVSLRNSEGHLATGVEIDASAGWNVDRERAPRWNRQVRHWPGIQRIGPRGAGRGDDEAIADRPATSVVYSSQAGDDDPGSARREVVDCLPRCHR